MDININGKNSMMECITTFLEMKYITDGTTLSEKNMVCNGTANYLLYLEYTRIDNYNNKNVII